MKRDLKNTPVRYKGDLVWVPLLVCFVLACASVNCGGGANARAADGSEIHTRVRCTTPSGEVVVDTCNIKDHVSQSSSLYWHWKNKQGQRQEISSPPHGFASKRPETPDF